MLTPRHLLTIDGLVYRTKKKVIIPKTCLLGTVATDENDLTLYIRHGYLVTQRHPGINRA